MVGKSKEEDEKGRGVLEMRILNTEKEDYHVHSFNYSDGISTVNEMVRFAGELGMKKIVFADHSQAALQRAGYPRKTGRTIIRRWRNVFNDVKVVFGVEADLLNEKGDVCEHIQGVKGDFIILSYHKDVYSGDKQELTQAFINAINRHHQDIDCIGHIYTFIKDTGIDVNKIIRRANKYNIPFELNCRYIDTGRHKTDMDVLMLMLSKAKSIYVNSDAHTLYELKVLRKKGFEFLKEHGFI